MEGNLDLWMILCPYSNCCKGRVSSTGRNSLPWQIKWYSIMGVVQRLAHSEPLHIPFSCLFWRSTLSTLLCIKYQYITIQYSALQNCIVHHSVVQYNTELTWNVHLCTTVLLSAVHDEVQDQIIFNSRGVSSKHKMGIIWKVNFLNVGKFCRMETPPD